MCPGAMPRAGRFCPFRAAPRENSISLIFEFSVVLCFKMPEISLGLKNDS